MISPLALRERYRADKAAVLTVLQNCGTSTRSVRPTLTKLSALADTSLRLLWQQAGFQPAFALIAAQDGLISPTYDEAKMSAYMKNQELEVSVDVGVGRGTATVWTCDLTKQYVAINGDYRS